VYYGADGHDVAEVPHEQYRRCGARWSGARGRRSGRRFVWSDDDPEDAERFLTGHIRRTRVVLTGHPELFAGE
jgi:hypothetical protein